MKIELERNGDTLLVRQEGQVVGEVRRIKSNDFNWTSYTALHPRHGRCKSEREALLHLGFKYTGVGA